MYRCRNGLGVLERHATSGARDTEDGSKGFISLGKKHTGSDQRPIETSISSLTAGCSSSQKSKRTWHECSDISCISFLYFAMGQGIPQQRLVYVQEPVRISYAISLYSPI